jgi:hypothetical protein
MEAAALGGKTLKGSETSREALLKDVRIKPGVGFLGNQGLKAAARCLGSL